MPYVTNENEFLSFTTKALPLARLFPFIEGDEVYYTDSFTILSCPSFDFLRELTLKTGDTFYYIYDYFVANDHLVLPQYIERLSQYPLIRVPNEFDGDMAWGEIGKSFPYSENNQSFVFKVSLSDAFFIAPPSMKWYIYADAIVEIAKLTTFIGLPDKPAEPLDGFLNKKDAEKDIMEYMKWKYSM